MYLVFIFIPGTSLLFFPSLLFLNAFQVIIRSRADVKLKSLAKLVTEWKDKKFVPAGVSGKCLVAFKLIHRNSEINLLKKLFS